MLSKQDSREHEAQCILNKCEQEDQLMIYAMNLSLTRTYAGLGACCHWLPSEIDCSGDGANYSVVDPKCASGKFRQTHNTN